MNIVTKFEGTLVTTSAIIAENTGNEHASVIKLVREYQSQLGELGGVRFQIEPFTTAGGEQSREISILNEQQSTFLLTLMRNSEIVVKFKLALVKAFFEMKEKSVPSKPAINFANPAEAARAWADEYERRQLAEATKAEIGSRREATAMNTASQATKKVARLEVELDMSKSYATIKRMEMKFHGQKFNWRLLAAAEIQMNVTPTYVFDVNYGKVRSYHADVWMEAYAIDINEGD